MFNYKNLSDVEFEMLCKDIMEAKLNRKLRIFAKGRDGGVDITDDTLTNEHVIQVKHYINSTYAALRTSLKKEVENVEEMSPTHYYVCCAQELTPANVNEIYGIFHDYMDGAANIITLKEIDEFLQKEENREVLRKHYKLWLESTNVLGEIFNQDIFVDCESLLYNIEEEQQKFVETSYYRECREILEHERLVLLLGEPGVGKTITTKMLALYFASEGYRIRYTTNGELGDIKKSISTEKERKEVILLDDCLGQHYFKMKETQENELLALVKYVLMNHNKMLILNSRVTIYKEANQRNYDFSYFMKQDNVKIRTINMSNISIDDKGRIFYNHLYFERVNVEYYQNLLKSNNYRRIIRHRNYTPRIMEYVTLKHNFKNIKPENYAEFVLECLEHPNEIWNDEFSRKLQQEDRILLLTLYSLTDTTIKQTTLERAYNFRLSNTSGIDTTHNVFEESLKRLQDSMLVVVDQYGQRMISVINPSVNDFLRTFLEKNQLELFSIRKNMTEYEQLIKLFAEEITKVIKSGEAEKINYPYPYVKEQFILTQILKENVQMKCYQHAVIEFFEDFSASEVEGCYDRITIFTKLLQPEFCDFYQVKCILKDIEIDTIFEHLDLNEFEKMWKMLGESEQRWMINGWQEELIENIQNAIHEYCSDIQEEEYLGNYNISNFLEQYLYSIRYDDRNDVEVDYSEAAEDLKDKIIDDVVDEIWNLLKCFPEEIKAELEIIEDEIEVNSSNIETYLEEWNRASYDDYDDDFRESSSGVGDMLGYIFK